MIPSLTGFDSVIQISQEEMFTLINCFGIYYTTVFRPILDNPKPLEFGRRPVALILTLKISDTYIKREDIAILLGVYIDNKLNFFHL